MKRRAATPACLLLALAACSGGDAPGPVAEVAEYYGTLEPFASEAVYFVVTDRFVDGDPGNNQAEQGGDEWHTFDRPVTDAEGRSGNIGYLGGDFRGILDHAAYISEMGFSAVWITPVVENPDQAFSGGSRIGEGIFADHGKTGYHGYWGVNFHEVDEHLESPGLTFADLTRRLRDEHDLKTVLDIVCNHGSPSWTMPQDQPQFGEIYDADGSLIADHQNLHPTELDPDGNPLHGFFHDEPDLAELSNLDDTNPAVLDYFSAAYLKWIDQGAAAFRVDTIRHMPHAYWKQFSARIRERHPGFFMFGESFNYDAAAIAQHTWTENGAISVLDFPGQQRVTEVFAGGAPYSAIVDYLHLEDGLYQNPYELMVFYDNHDMPRMAADEAGFIDAHNWLFTSRGIPVIYYGSEMAFRAGMPEHGGNRDYFGADNIAAARMSAVRDALAAIAGVRRASPALQRGLQVNLDFGTETASFLRVYQHAGTTQTALVLLNKGDAGATMTASRMISAGSWRDAMTDERFDVSAANASLTLVVPAHGVRVLLFDDVVGDAELDAELASLHAGARRR